MKKYQYFLFDWDGCLVDTLSIWLDAYRKVFSEFHVQAPDRDIVDKMFGDWNGSLKFGIKNVTLFNEKLMAYVNANMTNVQLHSGVLSTLKRIKDEMKKIAVISSSKRNTVMSAMNSKNISPYVDLVLAEEDVSHHKPHPEVIEKALSFFKGKKSEAVIIGDTEKDIQAGKNAGIDTILFFPEINNTYYDKKKLLSFKPTYVLEEFTQILLKV